MTSRQRRWFYACLAVTLGVCVILIARTLYEAGAGDARAFVLREMWMQNAVSTLAGLLSLSFGTLLLLAALVGGCLHARYTLPMLHLAGVLTCAGLWASLQTGLAALLLPNAAARALLMTFALLGAPLFAALYLRTFVAGAPARILLLDACVALLALLNFVCLQAFHVLQAPAVMDAASAILFVHAACWCACLYLGVEWLI